MSDSSLSSFNPHASASQMPSSQTPRLICVIGRAGAGHSTALHTLEDAGFTAVDNLPLALVDQLISMVVETENRPLAIGIDVRTAGFDVSAIERLTKNLKLRFLDDCQIVCVTASDDELIKRYKATRRRHPFMNETTELAQAVLQDSHIFSNMEDMADVVLDSTSLTPHEFGADLRARLGIVTAQHPPLSIISFSYRTGLPPAADMVFDMRFVQNPHWQADLRALTGQNEKVQHFVQTDKAFTPFMHQLVNQLETIMPLFVAQGRHQLTIGFGCTGGRHRSVASACWLASWAEQQGIKYRLAHRELGETLS